MVENLRANKHTIKILFLKNILKLKRKRIKKISFILKKKNI